MPSPSQGVGTLCYCSVNEEWILHFAEFLHLATCFFLIFLMHRIIWTFKCSSVFRPLREFSSFFRERGELQDWLESRTSLARPGWGVLSFPYMARFDLLIFC